MFTQNSLMFSVMQQPKKSDLLHKKNSPSSLYTFTLHQNNEGGRELLYFLKTTPGTVWLFWSQPAPAGHKLLRNVVGFGTREESWKRLSTAN